MRTTTKIFLTACLAIGLLATCTVLLPDEWGGPAWPCDSDADCKSEYHCQWHLGRGYCMPIDLPACREGEEYRCFDELEVLSAFCHDPGGGAVCIPFYEDDDKIGFGERCIESNDCAGATGAPKCICFYDEENCFCSEECEAGSDQCDFLKGEAVCMATGIPRHYPYACGRMAITSGIGSPCEDNGDCPWESVCIDFPNLGHDICAETCDGEDSCPYNLECATIGNDKVCAFRDWLGFYVTCTTDTDCSTMYPLYSICPEEYCTRECSSNGQCPYGTNCQNSTFCILN